MIASVRAIAAAAGALVCASSAAIAQVVVPPSDLPGRQRERFELPAVPLAKPGGPIITQPGVEAPPGAAETVLVVREITIIGSTIYTAADLKPLYADLIGEKVTLKDVYDLAGRITAKYGADGYVLSRAVIPPQELDPNGAVIRIQVVEGYIEKVEWPPQVSGYADFFSYYANKITAERPVNIRTIERYLLLAGDLPGLKFKNTIKPHPSKQGAAILIVEVTIKPLDYYGRVDNRGTPARGPMEFMNSATVNNLLHIHDALTMTYAGAFKTRELTYYGLNYRQVITPEGLTFFATGSYGYGRPGTLELELLNYRTKSQYVETGLSYPVIRARERNLNVSGLWFWSDDRSSFFDLPSTPPSTLDKIRGFRVKVDADSADQTGGINQVNFVYSEGIQGLGSTHTGDDLASRANGRTDFTKMELLVTRMQPLFSGFSLLLSSYAQYARTPLLVSEQCGYGGRVFGRAFDPSQFIADSCVEALAELRYDIPLGVKEVTQAQLYAYADHGWLHNIAPVLGTFRDVDAASLGAGLRLGWLNALAADLSIAQVAQGQNLSGTNNVPVSQPVGIGKVTRFFFILSAKL